MKIKSLESIRLTHREADSLYGGCVCNNLLTSNAANPMCCQTMQLCDIPDEIVILPKDPTPTKPDICNCAGCIVEDGGTGFMLGMNWQL